MRTLEEIIQEAVANQLDYIPMRERVMSDVMAQLEEEGRGDLLNNNWENAVKAFETAWDIQS